MKVLKYLFNFKNIANENKILISFNGLPSANSSGLEAPSRVLTDKISYTN